MSSGLKHSQPGRDGRSADSQRGLFRRRPRRRRAALVAAQRCRGGHHADPPRRCRGSLASISASPATTRSRPCRVACDPAIAPDKAVSGRTGRRGAASSRSWPTSRDDPQAARPGAMSSAPKIPLKNWPV
jgi:hypothetical protein